ncbi:MAG: glycoside hydrolase family 43 protein [Gemmatimonadota bacterium]|nr:glycoside hydrolase family 43 protein [Gemmatimonadota bacterium]
MQTIRIRSWIRAAGFVFLATCSNAAAVNDGTGPPPPLCTFKNPIDVGADPWVTKSGGFYYFTESRDNGIYVYKSQSLTTLKQNGIKIWSAPATGWNETNIWAPELHQINGLWYVYYAAGRRHANGSDAPFTSQRAGVLESTTADPQGAYVDKGMLYTGSDVVADTGAVWAIDLTVGDINGQLYAVWSGWDQNNSTTDKIQQNLYIARMSSPLAISSNRVKIAAPDASWETGPELPLEEGPEFLQHGGQEFIIYSTNDSWLRTYQLGQLRLTSATADPLNPASYVKSGPVFSGTNDVYGVGHASFTTSPDGTEDWIVYHSKIDVTPGWNRVIRTQKFSWNLDGSPNFGLPTPTGESVRMPAGQCK